MAEAAIIPAGLRLIMKATVELLQTILNVLMYIFCLPLLMIFAMNSSWGARNIEVVLSSILWAAASIPGLFAMKWYSSAELYEAVLAYLVFLPMVVLLVSPDFATQPHRDPRWLTPYRTLNYPTVISLILCELSFLCAFMDWNFPFPWTLYFGLALMVRLAGLCSWLNHSYRNHFTSTLKALGSWYTNNLLSHFLTTFIVVAGARLWVNAFGGMVNAVLLLALLAVHAMWWHDNAVLGSAMGLCGTVLLILSYVLTVLCGTSVLLWTVAAFTHYSAQTFYTASTNRAFMF